MNYYDQMHRMGRISMAVMLVLMLSVPFYICLVFDTSFHFNAGYWAALGAMLIQYIPSGILEVITYAPLLGTGGTYLGFISGNLINLKVPCAMNARDIAKAEPGTEENEVISTIAISVCTIVTTLVIALGVICIVPLTPLLESKVLTPAFKTVVPALFGGMGFVYVKKYPKIAIVPWVLAVMLFLLMPSLTSMVSIMVVVLAVIAMVSGHVLYKRGKI
ncbi:MAG: hypothetical protein SOI52_05165 [Erysipelotrichaceae bacterium]|jgi:hypothetical protein